MAIVLSYAAHRDVVDIVNMLRHDGIMRIADGVRAKCWTGLVLKNDEDWILMFIMVGEDL